MAATCDRGVFSALQAAVGARAASVSSSAASVSKSPCSSRGPWSRDAAKRARRDLHDPRDPRGLPTSHWPTCPPWRAASTGRQTDTFAEVTGWTRHIRPTATASATRSPLLQRSRGIATTATRHEAASESAAGAFSAYPQEEWHPGAVHVRIAPRPRTLGESADVLQALRQFGEVEMFRHLKYAPHAPAMHVALAIFRSPDAAQRAIAASPIEFAFGGGLYEARDDDVRRRADVPAALPDHEAEQLAREDSVAASAAADATADIDPESDVSDDPVFRSELDSAQDLVSAADPDVFPPGRRSTAIKPPWEMAMLGTASGSAPGPASALASKSSVMASSEARAESVYESSVLDASNAEAAAHSESIVYVGDSLFEKSPALNRDANADSDSPIELRTLSGSDSAADAEPDVDSEPDSSSSIPQPIDPSRPISLPRVPDVAPVVAAAPAYRASALTPRARQHEAAAPPSFGDDPTYAPAPRAASLVVSGSGFAHRFYNARQPYASIFTPSPAAYPGPGLLAPLPTALRGLADSDVQKPELAARQRAKKEDRRLQYDLLAGMSLRDLWREGARERERAKAVKEREGV